MTKKQKTKKTEMEDTFSKNHNHAIKYRKRIQEEQETEKELKDYAGKPLQDILRRDDFSE